jgi:aminopeptidase N
MRTDIPQPIRLSEYRPPAFLVEEVHLDFRLHPTATRARARLQLRRNGPGAEPLRLDGVGLKLISIAVDGEALQPGAYRIDDAGLTLPSPPDTFVLETEVEIDPAANTALEGLYISGGRFCTQCEAEGFRKITYFPDRPDVLARYTVRIEAPRAYARLLSNGNRIQTGELDGDRHYAVWRDPFPKPAYLFALVAGELDMLEDRFTTASGREVALEIYVDPGQTARAVYALDALKRAMAWDERAYGREYDLDLFMIVAVRDFNFGAMENKGLNIFNSSLLLADPETATDADFERIESVVAHEYFHNWTGNRITCRDWFQLCLKEGFTVYRDQGFSADQRSAAVQRIKDVRTLRARQFPEDAGPLAHPVRPSSYIAIDNFYTATVYEKGAELIGVLRELVGEDAFRRGCDLYFDRLDGAAATMEQFVDCFAETAGADLSRFLRWYGQPGTPGVHMRSAYDAEARTLDLTLTQEAPAGREAAFQPVPIPVRLGVLDQDGRAQSFRMAGGTPVHEHTAVLVDERLELRLEGLERPPVVSALRGFSAPVRLTSDAPGEDRYVLLAGDPDLFNRWEAGQQLAAELVLARAGGRPDPAGELRYAEAVGRALGDQSAEPALKALLLQPPSEGDLSLMRAPYDPHAVHGAREVLRGTLGRVLEAPLARVHEQLAPAGPYSPGAEAAGRRALRNGALQLLVAGGGAAERAQRHFAEAANMTDALAGLDALAQVGGAAFEAALADFYARWAEEPLVVDKWFAVQARSPEPGVLGRVIGLTAHPAFDRKNPNRLRALVHTFSGNLAAFHAPNGSGYQFLVDQIIAVDTLNPKTAARLVEPLGGWRRLTPALSEEARRQLERLAAGPGLSDNVLELASKALT